MRTGCSSSVRMNWGSSRRRYRPPSAGSEGGQDLCGGENVIAELQGQRAVDADIALQLVGVAEGIFLQETTAERLLLLHVERLIRRSDSQPLVSADRAMRKVGVDEGRSHGGSVDAVHGHVGVVVQPQAEELSFDGCEGDVVGDLQSHHLSGRLGEAEGGVGDGGHLDLLIWMAAERWSPR